MAEPNNEMKAIEKISGVVGESQVKIIISNQCIKAQAFLVNRLKRQFQRQKDISKFISNDNLKLEAEIKNAEQEIKSLMLAHESIKSSNVELKKEWQLAKESSQETLERIQIGEKKYDELWEQAKSRYESIGFVQNWLQAKKKKEVLEDEINVLDKETRGLLEEIKNKEDVVSALNKKRIIEFAEYFVNEKPKIEKNISVLSQEIEKLNGQIKKRQDAERQDAQDIQNKEAADIAEVSQRARALKLKIDDGWPNLNKNLNGDGNTLMPKLQLMNIDLEVMSVKLDQIKKSDLATTSPLKVVNSEHKPMETGLKLTLTPDKQHIECSSLYFNKSGSTADNGNVTAGGNDKNHNYSKRKLINILEDIKLDKKDTYNIVSKVNTDNLQGVSMITSNANKNNEIPLESTNEMANDAANEEIEVLDLTSHVDHVILPPSGFLDQLRSSQEQKKKVSFELPASAQPLPLDSKNDNPADDDNGENEANVTINSPMDDTAGSEESFTKIKDMILKKHNLDLSPQFVYGKNTPMHLKSDEVVRSNYFKLSCEEPQPSISGTQAEIVELPNEDGTDMECDEPIQTGPINEKENEARDNIAEMDVEENIICSAKQTQEKLVAKPVAGLLFNHGSLGLPDSLDVSISTTGFEDGDPDYPQYSSLLMSPKADLPIPSTNENAEVISQDVPNFLSGLRKTGLSFFGNMIGTNTNTENASAPAANNNFNFAFGSDDKKSRGGLFNMFN